MVWTPPPLPIYSREVLQLFLLEQVTGGSVVFWASSMEGGSVSISVDYSETGKVKTILAKLSEGVAFRLKNEDDKINVFVALWDQTRESLFVGGTAFKTEDIKEKMPAVQLFIKGAVKIRLPSLSDLESAELLFLNADGTTHHSQALKIGTDKNGVFLEFPAWYAGAKGVLLSARFKGGHTASYSLTEPAVQNISEENARLGEQLTISGHRFYADPVIVEITALYGTRPTAEITITKEATVDFLVRGVISETEWEWPVEMVVMNPVTAKVVSYKLVNGRYGVWLSEGRHLVFWKWNRFGVQDYTGFSDGGKG